jgi:hypothetical protein
MNVQKQGLRVTLKKLGCSFSGELASRKHDSLQSEKSVGWLLVTVAQI